jgi:hypothetical protein
MELSDLSRLLGGPAQTEPTAGLVLDVSPTLAVGIGRVLEIADVARSPFHQLPGPIAAGLSLFVRGAVEHQGQLFLELIPEMLAQRPPALPARPPRPVIPLEELPPRALVIESGGHRFGIPLPWVSQVVPRSPGACAMPGMVDVLELFSHGQVVWPVFSTPSLIGGEACDEPLRVLTELAGQTVAFTASSALGVKGPFEDGDSVLFLDLQRMFS